MSELAAVVGMGQTKHSSKNEKVSMAGLVRESAEKAIQDAKLDWADIDAVIIGKAPDMFEGVMMPELYLSDALVANGKPMLRVHTAGSVGGSTGVVAASYIQSGLFNTVLVSTYEKQSESNAMWALSTTVPYAPLINAGAGGYFTPYMREYKRRYKVPEHIGRIVAVKDRLNALKNPHAHLHIPDISLKMVQESISFTSANAFAIDAGSQYISRFSGLRIGMAITNFGTKMRLNGTDQKIDIDPFEELDGNPDVIANLRTEDWPLPMAFRFGFSIQPLGPESIIKNPLFVVMVNADYYDGRDLSPYYAIGTELKVKNLLYLRSGLKREFLRYEDSINNVSIEELNNPENSGFYVNRWSWGFGITSESFPNIPYKLNLDYSVSDLGILGISSQIGLTFKL